MIQSLSLESIPRVARRSGESPMESRMIIVLIIEVELFENVKSSQIDPAILTTQRMRVYIQPEERVKPCFLQTKRAINNAGI